MSKKRMGSLSQAVRRPVRAVYQTFQEFDRLEASGGIVLIIAALVAMVWANSPWAESYTTLWKTPLTIGLGSSEISHDLHWWINEALMVIFFLVVGLEIKREMLVGELSSLRQAALPVAAALGGMLLPAGIYLLLNAGGEGVRGWGVPMATDIAFALGIMALLGQRAPISLKIFLTSLAIVDDIGAVLVIALFYTAEIQWLFLGLAGAVILALIVVNFLGIRTLLIYSLLGIFLWFAILLSGLHATLAGVILALLIPAKNVIKEEQFVHKAHDDLHNFQNAGKYDQRLLTAQQQDALQSLEVSINAIQTPLQQLEHGLHYWVIYAIIPLFALANAGISVSGDLSAMLNDRITLGVIAGLLFGKQLGVILASRLTVWIGWADLPKGISWWQIYGAGWLAGIGFTMSLFISELAFINPANREAAKIGILIASIAASLVGYLTLRFAQVSKQNPD